ncbi:MAG TPA: phosphopantetheine-binding protein, partial [Acidimicrobiales bacterium]|nr:phosphopantetheine-binding protein [Acidimicrobiales bacterium]
VRAQVATVLGHASSADVEVERAFKELGFDSLGAVELRNRLESATGLRLPSTVAFDYPNVIALARHVGAQASGSPSDDLIGRLEAFEKLMGSHELNGDERTRLAQHLRRLLHMVDSEGDRGRPDHPADDWIRSASDQELFAFIDRQLKQD